MLTALNMTVSILKLRIGSFIALGALMGCLTGGGAITLKEAIAFSLAVLGAAGAAGAYNQYYERDTDRLMARTHNRPFASGVLKPAAIWPLTFLALLESSLLLAWAVGGTLAASLVLAGAATYAIVYTVWLKKYTSWNVVIGGAAGSFAILAGAAAAAPAGGPAIGLTPLVLAAVLFLWTPPHFWALAAARGEDYRRANVPMLPVVTTPDVWTRTIFYYVLALVLLSFVPAFIDMGPVYVLFAALGGLPFLHASWRLMRSPERKLAMATFRASLMQFALLSLGVILDGIVRWAV